jgi:hypothetical protein
MDNVPTTERKKMIHSKTNKTPILKKKLKQKC